MPSQHRGSTHYSYQHLVNLETGLLGPVPWRDIQWIEVDTVEERHISRLVPPKRIDHSDSLINALRSAGLPCVRIDRVIRIQPETPVNP
ncbi:DUF6678 family protein [Acaryochloris sp. CCMEE 5410]|uniref:DUF6678 family protein n=1 Tax=Acaryochloris sp. CCMEE 5410 TaxID=310037 RepID=UPI0037BE372A